MTIPTTDLYTFGGNTDLLEEFMRREVRFLVVGGLAVQFHAPEREADDLDLLLDPSPDNASSSACRAAIASKRRRSI